MDLLGPGWAASLQLDAMDEPPKIVLAALVEMLGYVPGPGDCMSVSKGKSGWSAQGMQDEVFETEYSTYFNRSYAERPLRAAAAAPRGPAACSDVGRTYIRHWPRLGSARKEHGLCVIPTDRLRSAE